MRILICCEDEDYVEVMKKILMKYHSSQEREFEICLTIEEAVEKTISIKFDMAFIDCLMEEENIMNVGRDVMELNPECMIFFMHTELDPTYINESFIIGTFQFLIKGEDDMMEKEFLRACQIYIRDNLKFHFITKDKEKLEFLPKDLLYVELKKSPTIVATKNVVYRGWFEEEMYLLEHHLKHYNFLQIHSHYLVSMDKVRKIGMNEIVMCNGDYLPIAVIKQEKIRRDFRRFLNW
ncbi:MAG: LytTR family transcriptional regulator DNA-binding domain-containing protein [Coprobacillus sp.]